MSGDTLAKLVGYKHQSSIGNLENRVNGTGGNKISQIADALGVPIKWLMTGPDGTQVPTQEISNVQTFNTGQFAASKSFNVSSERAVAGVQQPPTEYELHITATQLLTQLDRQGKQEAVDFLSYLVAKKGQTDTAISWQSHSVSRHKSA